MADMTLPTKLSVHLANVRMMAFKHGQPMSPGTQRAVMQDTRWADGLRGIAALFVVSSHLVLCFARRLVLPCCSEDGSHILWFQLPIFRLIAAGHAWVALFFILSGFVNSLKPLKLAKSNQVESALSNMAVSSFRRTFRLVLPATFATIISWFICQLGMYEMARNGDAYWLYTYTPRMSWTWGTSIDDLFSALASTWALKSINPYDQPQWALIYLLMGSMFCFCALLITINLTSFWRTVTLTILAMWSLDWSQKSGDPVVGFTIFLGMVLAEFALSDIPSRLAPLSLFLSPLLVFTGLFFMSMPTDFVHQAKWSWYLEKIGEKIFPLYSDIAREWASTGAIILVSGIIISPHLRSFLSQPPLVWLGKVSFPVYLLHGLFMRSMLGWLTFTGQTPQLFDVEGGTIYRYGQPSGFRIWIAIIFSMGTMLLASHYWSDNIEPIFGTITKKAEELVFDKGVGDRAAANGSRPVLPVRKD